MSDNEIASKVYNLAEQKGGSVAMLDLPYPELEYAIKQGWLLPAGVGHFEITRAGRAAAGRRGD